MLFYVCFGVGVGYTLLSFFLGEALNIFHFDTEFDTHFEMGDVISPLKPSVIAAFITVFGGAGIIASRQLTLLPACIVAALFGFVVAFLFYRFIIVPLYKAQNTSAVEKQSLIGFDAKVSEGIPQGGYGKITYYANGNTYTAPAKAEGGGGIKRNSSVEITCIEKNTFFVRKKEEKN